LTCHIRGSSINAVVTNERCIVNNNERLLFEINTAAGKAQMVLDRLYVEVQAGNTSLIKYCDVSLLVAALVLMLPKLFRAHYGFVLNVDKVRTKVATHTLFPMTGSGGEHMSVAVEWVPHAWLTDKASDAIIDVIPPGCTPATYPIARPLSGRPAYIDDREMFDTLRGVSPNLELVNELCVFLEEKCKDFSYIL
jgi:hypothetical protein